MQIPRKPFIRLAPFTVAACLVVAAGCDGPAQEASHPAELDEPTTLSGLVTAQVRATDFTALAQSLNPIVNTGGGGCSSTRATIDTVEYGDVTVAVAPTASGSTTRITVLSPVIRGQLQYRLLCLTFRTTFTVRADAYEVDGLVVPRIDTGRLAVAFASPTGAFSGLRVELTGIPGINSVVNQLVGAVQGPFASTLAQAVAAALAPRINDFLAGPGMTELTGSIASAITDADLTAAFDPANPIVDVGSGCTHVRVFVSSATHGPGEVALDQTADGIDTAISVPALAMTGRIDYDILCIEGSSAFSVTADAYQSAGVLALGVNGAAVTAGFETTTSAFDNLVFEVSGIPGAVVDLIVDPLRNQLASAVGAGVAQVLPPRVVQFYADFLSH
jgi:hypothetical protein